MSPATKAQRGPRRVDERDLPADESPAAPAVGLMSIGEVLNRLRGDFADVTISKIRFLESAGLVEPHRTASGYRKFSLSDVERLRYVLAAQRDHYLPLRVIREHLDALDRGLEPPSGLGSPRAPRTLVSAPPVASPQDFAQEVSQIRLSRVEVLRESGIDAELFDRLHEVGLVAPVHGRMYDTDALDIARAVAGMAKFGFDSRHLRSYKSAADREAGLVEQVVAPLMRQRDGEGRAAAGEAARELAALSVQLHAALVRRALPHTLRD